MKADIVPEMLTWKWLKGPLNSGAAFLHKIWLAKLIHPPEAPVVCNLPPDP